MMDYHSNPEATESQLAEALGTTSGDNTALGLHAVHSAGIYTHHIYIYICYIEHMYTYVFDQQRDFGLQWVVAFFWHMKQAIIG